MVYLHRWHGWCHMKLLPSRRVLCTPYNHAPCHFMQSHIRKVYACLAVTCHLHFWRNDRGLLRATAVTWGWNGYQNKSQHRKLTLEKKIRSSTRARPILVRFFDRKKRDSVIISRRNLKNKGIVIGEDLTYANYQVFRKASEHSATMSVWSSNGKILAKVKNGRIVRVNIHTDLDEAFRRAMSGNEMSADEGE